MCEVEVTLFVLVVVILLGVPSVMVGFPASPSPLATVIPFPAVIVLVAETPVLLVAIIPVVEMLCILSSLPVTDMVLFALRSPPPVSPVPAVIVTELSTAPISDNDHETFPEPFTDLPVPPIVNVLAISHVDAVEAFPESEAVIVPAEKFPLASLATIVEAVEAEVALTDIVGVAPSPAVPVLVMKDPAVISAT